MIFDPDNKVVALCVKGMEMEGLGNSEDASSLFNEAWSIATTGFEKFTAAHYVARHQKTITDKLKWDKIALGEALHIDDQTIKGSLPSLYLNIAKGYEELGDRLQALENYHLAKANSIHLNDDGYGNMIKAGIENGIKRMNSN